MHATSSLEQQNIEKYIFQILCDELGIKLSANPVVHVETQRFSRIFILRKTGLLAKCMHTLVH
ncbi:hypothetical protein [Sporolactobacillus sp. THM19-2]|jgi:hypothetical protein|uniref:hypothetical protein n=1 Tax=Sporolactobacillus sp. THM19-2 TaxID=2511171 RepID=UPI001F106349|nr:hypothetical protein [Sporolactobacillus sp. THM19-2]